jgi:hypothetical protein
LRQFAVQLAERCTEPNAGSDDLMTIDCSALADANRHVVREMFVALWQSRDWPRQAMGFAEWDALAAMALGNADDNTARVFPGNIAAERMADTLQLKRRGGR